MTVILDFFFFLGGLFHLMTVLVCEAKAHLSVIQCNMNTT